MAMLPLHIIMQVPNKRVSSASEPIRGTRKVSPGPKSADSKDQEEEQGIRITPRNLVHLMEQLVTFNSSLEQLGQIK